MSPSMYMEVIPPTSRAADSHWFGAAGKPLPSAAGEYRRICCADGSTT
jgi:hypothetical protein